MVATYSASYDAASHHPVRIPKYSRNGSIKVAVRLCPCLEELNGPRKAGGISQDGRAWICENEETIRYSILKGLERRVEGHNVFQFDHIFDENIQTSLVYKSVVRPMVPAVLNGKHATIFAYGQTGSGKTFTMQGEEKTESYQAGIIQMVIADVFQHIRQTEAPKRVFEVKASYFEIYNEKIRDLLAVDVKSASSDGNASSTIRNDEVNIRANFNGEIVVNVEHKKVKNVDEALKILVKGNAHRSVATTNMNARSSRSHSIFRLTIESREISIDKIGNSRVSDFNLVDLAGSESLKFAKTTGIRQREGATINKSLLALTNVIQCLSQPTKKKPQYINYRDSKLTRILQPHLSGNAEMAILCCATCSKNFIEETRSTLKFASRAKLVQMKPKINFVSDNDAIIRRLQTQLFEARQKLESTEKKLQEELERKPTIINPNFDVKKVRHYSSETSDGRVDEIMDGPKCQIKVSNSVVAEKAVGKFKNDHLDSFDPNEFLDSSRGSTANLSTTSEYERSNEKRIHLLSIEKVIGTIDHKHKSNDSYTSIEYESFGRLGTNPPNTSLNIYSEVSNPETIDGKDELENARKAMLGSQDLVSFSPNGRLEHNVSWDAMALSTKSLTQTGKPFRRTKSQNNKMCIIPDEITIIEHTVTTGRRKCFTDHLQDSEARIKFLEENLALSDNIIEASYRDRQRARQCIRDLVQRNIKMKAELSKKSIEDTFFFSEKGEIIVEHYWILKALIYSGVFFFLSRSQEHFLATAFFVWLALETNMTA